MDHLQHYVDDLEASFAAAGSEVDRVTLEWFVRSTQAGVEAGAFREVLRLTARETPVVGSTEHPVPPSKPQRNRGKQ